MEKKRKNIVLLVGLIMLLVGLSLGTTFGYFVASVRTINDEGKDTVIETVEFASATMDLGNKITASNILPGYKQVKALTVEGDKKEGTRSIKANITLSPEVTNFGNHIKYYLYERNGINPINLESICKDSNPVNDKGSHYDAMTCDTSNLGEPILEGIFVGREMVTKTIDVTSDMEKTYYLIVEYLNDPDNAQDEEQGKSFTVTIGFVPYGESGEYRDTILNGADPILADNLVPVVIDEAGNVKKANTSKEWYNYEKKLWANAVKTVSSKEYANEEVIPESDIESYFVWIPRYKYKIFDDGNYSTATTRENAVEPIEIVFEDKSAIPSNGVTVGSFLTHPAFTAFDVNGLWVGKFETGYKNAGSTSAAQVNAEQPTNIVIKPNVYSWREIQVANAFYTSYNYLRKADSHMMKNMEWGAVSYLTNSIYGRCTGDSCEEIRINNNQSYVTGYAATDASKDSGYEGVAPNSDGTKTLNYKNPLSVKASTTGNYSGIYDMSGGAWEYVMGVMNDSSGNPASGSTASANSGFKGSYTNESGVNTTGRDWPDAKYYDTYAYSTSETDYARRRLGDATGEMGPFSESRSSWYEDYAIFVRSAYPWFVRGGNYSHGSNAGVFYFNYAYGRAGSSYSFRVVLAPEAL